VWFMVPTGDFMVIEATHEPAVGVQCSESVFSERIPISSGRCRFSKRDPFSGVLSINRCQRAALKTRALQTLSRRSGEPFPARSVWRAVCSPPLSGSWPQLASGGWRGSPPMNWLSILFVLFVFLLIADGHAIKRQRTRKTPFKVPTSLQSLEVFATHEPVPCGLRREPRMLSGHAAFGDAHRPSKAVSPPLCSPLRRASTGRAATAVHEVQGLNARPLFRGVPWPPPQARSPSRQSARCR